MYDQSTAPTPPSDLPPVVAPVSAEPVSSAGPPPMVPAVVRHDVVPTHTAQMVLFVQAICIPAQFVQMWLVIILRNACIYIRPEKWAADKILCDMDCSFQSLFFS